MRICQVLCGRGTGGLERHFVDLCNHLAERHEVIAIAHPEFRDRLSPRVDVEALDLSGWRYHPLLLARLYGLLRTHRPDIVHAQANKAAAMVGLLRPWLRAHCVATVHNLKRDTAMFRGYDRLIAVSRKVAEQFDQSQVDVIYNGIAPVAVAAEDGAHALRDAAGGMPGPVAVAVGRLVPAKGFDQLLRAWQGVAATLLIVGDGPERLRLEALLRELNLGGRVRLCGFRRDVPALLAAADVMVMASRNEGFPYVLVEGLHARRVVVSTRVPGALDILPPEFLVEYGDPGQLAGAVNRVLANLDAARRAFVPVWEFAARELTLARMVEKTEEVYRRVLGGPARHERA